MAEERLRRNLDVALDPGPDFPSQHWLPRTMAMLEQEDATSRVGEPVRRSAFGLGAWFTAPRALALMAALLAIVIVATLLFAGQILHPRQQVPVKSPVKGVATGRPSPVNPPTVMDCPTNCLTVILKAASPSVVWAIVTPTGPGPTNVYRSVDGGEGWKAVASWNPPTSATDQLIVSTDGKQATFVLGSGLTVFHTADGGAHWSSFGLPLTVAPNQGLQAYFLNPNEGWLVSPDSTPQTDDLFHTSDAGASWILSSRVAASGTFDLLHGRLVFQSSSAGWLVPEYNGSPLMQQTIYATTDAGLTWHAKTLAAVPISTEQIKPHSFAPVHAKIVDLRFFNDREGVIEVQSVSNLCGGPGPIYPDCFRYDLYGPMAVYLTSDGGASWSAPRIIPSAEWVDFIDADHWIAPGLSIARTTDSGKTWDNIRAVFQNAPTVAQFLFQSMTFVDPSDGFAWMYCGGGWGGLLRTSDGGAHWVSLALPSNQPIRYDCPTI